MQIQFEMQELFTDYIIETKFISRTRKLFDPSNMQRGTFDGKSFS